MRHIDLFEADITPEMEERFGRVLFGDWQYSKGLTKERERDTEYEKKVFELLQEWFAGGQLDENVQKAMRALSLLKDNYPTILKPDKTEFLYRGLEFAFREPSDDFPDVFELENIKDHDLELKKGTYMSAIDKSKFQIFKVPRTYTYRPEKYAESWTTSLEMAINIFANHFTSDTDEVIYIKARVPMEQRLFGLHFTNTMYGLMKQNEVIRVTTDPIEVEVFVSDSGGQFS